ncbi:glycosyltransferase family 4 protein [Clostridium saudiense]|uniref:glycosyltransferase family 4 protein n=1 Tax=Clostridium saudiense TaxID=1414720 RepID=UPI0018AAC45A|nr:glycosyltransferase family 4 protein [Clostridium saudiense]
MNDKNILYITRTMGIGGTEKVILQLCRAFNGEFNKIIICSTKGVHIHELNHLGIKHYEIPDFEDKSIKNIIKTFRKIVKILNKEKIDIVHTHHRMAALYTRIIRCFRPFIQIHTAHNTFYDKKMLTRLALNNTHVVCVGKKVKENLVSYYNLDKSMISIVYNGIKKEEQKFIPIKQLEQLRKNDYFLVGNIGRLSEQKGMEYFIKAAKIIKYNGVKVKFVIIGDGELDGELKMLAKEIGVDDDVIFLGYRNDISNVIKHCDIIVLSSLWEGLPLTPIEAFMEKKTVIATKVDGTPEIVEDGINGILIEPHNVEEIGNAVINILNNPNMRKRMEKKAYETYLEKFTIKIFNEKYRKYYEDLINDDKNI